MYYKHIIFSALLMIAVLPTVARANDYNAHNVRCLLATIPLANSTDKNVASIGESASFFFQGKIFGANPNIDLLGAIRHEWPTMTAESTKALWVECGAEMQDSGERLKAVGEQLQKDAVKKSGSMGSESLLSHLNNENGK